jgi:hypothetical protein
VKVVSIPPDQVVDASAITELQAAKPDLFFEDTSSGYGSVWDAMLTANWSPPILASAGVWYDALSSMGPLESNAYSAFENCATSATESMPAEKAAWPVFRQIVGAGQVNLNASVGDNLNSIDMVAYAIKKEHSLAPNAIAKGIESIRNVTFNGFLYNFSPTQHYGLTGSLGAAVCNVGPPYAGGALGLIPTIATK